MKIIKERMNQKEGTTYLSTISMDSDLKLPLFIVARGRSELCEKKHEINTENDDFISHSLNGWTTVNIMVEYLNWISEKMDNQPFALLLDSYKAHKHPTVIEEAKKLGIDLIYIPSCGTAKFQPLDRFVFGFLKKKLRAYDIEMDKIDPTKRFSFIHEKVKNIWNEMSSKIVKKAWEIPGLKDYVYRDTDPKDEDYQEE